MQARLKNLCWSHRSFKGKVLSVSFLLFFFYQLWILLHIILWTVVNPGESAFMESRLEHLQEKDEKATLRHQWVNYNQISIHIKQAVIAAEDAKFIDHEGFDWEGIEKAYEKNKRRKKIVAGGSTISQQLAKNLFLSNQRTPWRKAEETIITLMLETILSKQRILEIYLNVIEWGNNVYGIESASLRYFSSHARDLNSFQSAKLASMIPNPKYYERHQDASGLIERSGIILSRMNSAQVP
ncbi:Monofunctional biosynthetic peptidoglycan transglycosylase [Candidatus Methylopumilus planktonicus]|uniref:Biosynthetic peptidoglycan transglycosylase n=1 Tax=Candidatus Methylopumilus planktonicus TaxID=1581557 RepID=A0A0D6EWY6_9PROT|nr:monofunctional biosynthetic peptidoglycan transglycosylase [Candidatus Methylopumilus planktonicus]CEZ20147.1 Monofunctional biosynthetic peptidoglycan transglycosylase [Candidatus Methylopumilus planktonicus]